MSVVEVVVDLIGYIDDNLNVVIVVIDFVKDLGLSVGKLLGINEVRR